MALTPLGKITTLFLDTSKAIFEDQTVYGSPEVDRNQVGIAVLAVKKDHAGVETILVVTGDQNDPLTDSEWTFTYGEDGWFRIYMLQVPVYSAIISYSKNQAVYNVATTAFYRSLTDSNAGNAPPDAVNWEPLITPAPTLVSTIDTSTASDNITYLAWDDILRGITETALGEIISDKALLDPIDLPIGDSTEPYAVIGLLLEAMQIADSRDLYSDGEKVARKAEKVVGQC